MGNIAQRYGELYRQARQDIKDIPDIGEQLSSKRAARSNELSDFYAKELLKSKMDEARFQQNLQMMKEAGLLPGAGGGVMSSVTPATPARGMSSGTPGVSATQPQKPTLPEPVKPDVPQFIIKPTTSFDPFSGRATISYTPIENPDYKQAVDRYQKEQDAKLDAKKDVLKLSENAKANFSRSLAMFQGIVSQLKGAQEEQKKLAPNTSGLGLWAGLKGQYAARTKRPNTGRIASAYGQKVETALAMNSILTGQNRIIRGVVGMVFDSLPGAFDPEEQAAAKLAQSISNAYKTTKQWQKAVEQGQITEEILKAAPTKPMKLGDKTINAIDVTLPPYQLTDAEEEELRSIMKDILINTSPAEPQTLGLSGARLRGNFSPFSFTAEQNALIDKYMKRYPGKSQQEVIRAMKKQGLL